MNSNVTEMTVRVLTADDAAAYRELRLEALRLCPESFGSSVEDEEPQPLSEFARRIMPNERSWVLGAFDQSGALHGVMGWHLERGIKSAHRSTIWGAYVRPATREGGVGSALLSAILVRAEVVPGLRYVSLYVWSENTAAKALYAKFGFHFVALHPEELHVGGEFIDEELWMLRLPDEDRQEECT